MKIPTIALALLATLPVLGAEKDTNKDDQKRPVAAKAEEGKKAPPKQDKAEEKQKKPEAGKKKSKPEAKADPKTNPRGMKTLDQKELEQLLTRYREERKDIVAKVNQTHDAMEGLKKEVKAKTDHLNKLQAEMTKTASAIEHLKKKKAAVSKAHEDGHAKEEMLKARIAELEKEMERRKEITTLEKQASELSRKAETLRKKAAELKKK